MHDLTLRPDRFNRSLPVGKAPTGRAQRLRSGYRWTRDVLLGALVAFLVGPVMGCGEEPPRTRTTEEFILERIRISLMARRQAAEAERLKGLQWSAVKTGADLSNAILLVRQDSFVEVRYRGPAPLRWLQERADDGGRFLACSPHVGWDGADLSVVFGPGAFQALGPITTDGEGGQPKVEVVARQVAGEAVVGRPLDPTAPFLPPAFLLARCLTFKLTDRLPKAGRSWLLSTGVTWRTVSPEAGIIGTWHEQKPEEARSYADAYQRGEDVLEMAMKDALDPTRAPTRPCLEVEAFLSGSLLEQMGVQIGDCILRSNFGHWLFIDDLDRHLRLMQAVEGGGLTVLRDQQRVDLPWTRPD